MKLYTANAIKWRDRINGNTYHSVQITRHADGAVLYVPFQYGYGEHYRSTALMAMRDAGWIKADPLWMWERSNDYPVIWLCSDGLKRDCVQNGTDPEAEK